jgi:hypothetical protein
MIAINFSQVKRMLALTGMAFLSFLLFAEGSGVVKGRVMDENNQPVEYATAILKNSKTNEFVTGNVCNNKGEFEIENVKPGEYTLSVSMIGYSKTTTDKVVLNLKPNPVVEKNVVLNETPDKAIVVVAKKKHNQNLLSAQR